MTNGCRAFGGRSRYDEAKNVAPTGSRLYRGLAARFVLLRRRRIDTDQTNRLTPPLSPLRGEGDDSGVVQAAVSSVMHGSPITNRRYSRLPVGGTTALAELRAGQNENRWVFGIWNSELVIL